MVTVERWTGAEAKALRLAMRQTVRGFGEHLGVEPKTVSKWEQRGGSITPRPETQEMLDTALRLSGEEVQKRFAAMVGPDRASTAVASDPVEITDGLTAHDATQDETAATSAANVGGSSGQRTAVLLDAAGTDIVKTPYQPDQVADERFQQFLDSRSRVFVLSGGAGSGKTRLTQYLAHKWSSDVDFQFHTCFTWASAATSLATEILRYASLPSGDDALLSLERASNCLERPCVVVVDSVDSEEQLVVVGRQVDGILRQANSNRLRFVIVARTPPDPDLSAFPVLAAAVFGHFTASIAVSHTMVPWTMAEARELWDRPGHDNQLPFADLPESLQSLARTPLYMQMLRSAGGVAHASAQSGTVNAFHLVDHCVRTVLSHSAQHVEAAMDHLAQLACELTPDAIPGPMTGVARVPRALSAAVGRPVAPFLEQAPDGRAQFTHDVFREYFLAVRIVDQMAARGRSLATVAAFNELAVRATRSAAARGVFDFVVCALNASAPNLIEVVALAPSIALDTALPMLLETAAANGAFASPDVIRACAHRRRQAPTRQLTRALLATPNLADALGNQHAPWVVEQLRTYGSEIWHDIARHVEEALDIRISTRILDCIDLDRAEEAIFLACHFDLFTGAGLDQANLLQQLLHHLDWRVRAGIAEALLGHRVLSLTQVNRIVDHLVRDDDYKVRAAVARAVGTLDAAAAHGHLQTLLTDHNWHVRERTLQGVLTGRQAPLPDPALARMVITTVAGDKSWAEPPVPAAKLLARIRLLNEDSSHNAPLPGDAALFGLLREVRSSWIELPSDLEQSLVACGAESSHWLTVREARAVRQRHTPQPGSTNVREQYRRRRGQRCLQIALDVHTLDRATKITMAAIDARVDFIEVGDPLIKRAGVQAIETIKRCAPDTAVVAEMMSADWGRDQVELAAEAGADVVLLIGPASIASVSAAVAAARRLGVALTLDAPPEHVNPSWLRDMERTGIDGFVVTTNIDLGIGGNRPLATARTIRTCSQLPVAVSGGFSTADDALTNSDDWDIAILGRSVADAVAQADIAHQLTTIARKINAKERL